MPLHVRWSARWASRGCAALTALWLVACGVLGLRHHAQVDHVRDARTGSSMHASGMTGHHDRGAVAADMHSRRDTGSHDAPCTLDVLHEASALWATPVETSAVLHHALSEVPPTAARVTRVGPVFRIAPKTSPPAA